jgi:Endosomal/lysosomal potassium channel TMEM175
MDRGRLEAFSDGVFAVAITLLALDLAVAGPGHGHGTLAHQLAHQWAGYVGYLISFFTIGIIWVNYHPAPVRVRRLGLPAGHRARVRQRPAALGLSGLVAVYYILEWTPAIAKQDT